jgi:predicted NUDIX family phosphoesterase
LADLSSMTKSPYVTAMEKISKSIDETSIDELIEELYNHPLRSPAFKDIQSFIRYKLTDDKYNEYLISFKSKMHMDYHIDLQKESLNELNEVRGIVQVHANNFNSNESHFSDDITFLEDPRFEVIERRQLEYNPEYKQLVVSSYITDGEYIILLHTGSNGETRIQGKYTFIQGHVDFNPNVYILSQKKFLLESLIREFKEEVNISEEVADIIADVYPKFYVNDNSNHIGIEHFGIIYELRVKDAQRLFSHMSSGEKTKHGVEIIRIKEYENYMDNLDNWVQMVVKKLAR